MNLLSEWKVIQHFLQTGLLQYKLVTRVTCLSGINPFEHFCTRLSLCSILKRYALGEIYGFIIPPEIPTVFHRSSLLSYLFPSVYMKWEETVSFFPGRDPRCQKEKHGSLFLLKWLRFPETCTWSFLLPRILVGRAMCRQTLIHLPFLSQCAAANISISTSATLDSGEKTWTDEELQTVFRVQRSMSEQPKSCWTWMDTWLSIFTRSHVGGGILNFDIHLNHTEALFWSLPGTTLVITMTTQTTRLCHFLALTTFWWADATVNPLKTDHWSRWLYQWWWDIKWVQKQNEAINKNMWPGNSPQKMTADFSNLIFGCRFTPRCSGADLCCCEVVAISLAGKHRGKTGLFSIQRRQLSPVLPLLRLLFFWATCDFRFEINLAEMKVFNFISVIKWSAVNRQR